MRDAIAATRAVENRVFYLAASEIEDIFDLGEKSFISVVESFPSAATGFSALLLTMQGVLAVSMLLTLVTIDHVPLDILVARRGSVATAAGTTSTDPGATIEGGGGAPLALTVTTSSVVGSALDNLTTGAPARGWFPSLAWTWRML